MAAERYRNQNYEENRAWHHRPQIQRVNGKLIPLTMSVRFPATDLSEVVMRLRAAVMKLDGRVVRQARTPIRTSRTASADRCARRHAHDDGQAQELRTWEAAFSYAVCDSEKGCRGWPMTTGTVTG
jgi:hypothetical protein